MSFTSSGADESAKPEPNLLSRPVPGEPGTFRRSRAAGDFVILEWATAYGPVGWAHSMKASSPPVQWLVQAVHGTFWERMHKAYAALVLPGGAPNLDLAPVLTAVDLHPDAVWSRPYEVTWRQMAAVLGTRPPWFHPALRDQDTISAWKPGDLPAVIPANHVETPARALLDLAADEPDGSPAAAACLWLARRIRRQDALAARQAVDEIRARAGDPGSDCAHVDVAAVPAPLLRAEDPVPAEDVLRAGWAQVAERRDVLAAAAARTAQGWDSGRAWPVGMPAEFDPASCPAAAEWTARLRPAPPGQQPTVLERELLRHVTEADDAELLRDEASGCPALRRTDHLGNVTVHACVPQRISTLAPLSEVTLSAGTVWVRTSDGGLWLAPSPPGRGLSWGYGGGGTAALAALLSRLLDDITGPPAGYEDAPPGLASLLAATPGDGATYTRAQLLAASAS